MGLEDWVSDRDGERKRDYSSQHPHLDKTHYYKQWLPFRDLSEQLTHLQRLAGSPVWTASLTGSSSHLKSPANGTYLLYSPFNDPGQGEASLEPYPTVECNFQSHSFRKSAQRWPATSEYILWATKAGRQISSPTQLLSITSKWVQLGRLEQDARQPLSTYFSPPRPGSKFRALPNCWA